MDETMVFAQDDVLRMLGQFTVRHRERLRIGASQRLRFTVKGKSGMFMLLNEQMGEICFQSRVFRAHEDGSGQWKQLFLSREREPFSCQYQAANALMNEILCGPEPASEALGIIGRAMAALDGQRDQCATFRLPGLEQNSSDNAFLLRICPFSDSHTLIAAAFDPTRELQVSNLLMKGTPEEIWACLRDGETSERLKKIFYNLSDELTMKD